MLKKIWYFFILFSILFATLNGNLNRITSVFTTASTQSVTMCISLLGSMCFWMGIMEIIKESGLINKISLIIKPLIKHLFNNAKNDKEAINAVVLNLCANILGLGNAATPFGIEAMKKLQYTNKNKNTLSDDMIMFLVLNTSCLQLLPTSIFAYRASLGAKNPQIVFIPIILTTLFTMLISIIIAKLFKRFEKC